MKCATSLLQFPLISGDIREHMAVRHGRRTALYVFRTAETQTGGRHLLELRKTAPDQLPACQRKCCCPCTKCVLAHLSSDHPGHLVDEVSSHHLWFDCRVTLLCALTKFSQNLSSEHGRSAADVGCAADGDSASMALCNTHMASGTIHTVSWPTFVQSNPINTCRYHQQHDKPGQI